MSNILSYSSLTQSYSRLKTKFGGSSKYRMVDGEIREMKSKRVKKDTKNKELRTYHLNKSKLKRKCFALSRLVKSKKFLAFYSISFPVGLNDEIAYKILNIWLTRCRKKSDLRTYIWIAERQKNGTVHFHLFTNDFMPIRKVNGFMASSLESAKKKGIEVLKEIKIENYNGVDVKEVGKNRKSLIGYIVKYVTKNNIEFHRLPWHCSRDVSRLFTSVNFEEIDKEKYLIEFPDTEEKYLTKKSDYYFLWGFKFTPNDDAFNDLDYVNEMIYNSKL